MRSIKVVGVLGILAVVIVLCQSPVTLASPDIYLKNSLALGVTIDPGRFMDFAVPTRADPAYFATSGGVEYYWYSPPYVGTIPGPRAHSFHLYYTAAVATTVTVVVYVAVQPDGSGIPALVSSKSYSLEAASTVTHVKIPDVIVIPETRLNGERIKLSISTEDSATIYFDSVSTPAVLNIVPPPSPVGGVIVPANKLAILTPLAALLGAIVAVTVIIVAPRKKPEN